MADVKADVKAADGSLPGVRVVWTAEMIRAKLLSDQVWVERGLVAIYRRQTELEKSQEATISQNGVGFGAFDAKMGTYLAKWCLSKRHLSGQFLVKGRRIVLKYVGQLVEVANSGGPKDGRGESAGAV